MSSEVSSLFKERGISKVGEHIKLPIFYLLLAGSFAGWQSLYNVHLDSLAYSSIQIGILNAIFISMSALVVPFWGVLADKFGNNRVFLLLTSMAAVLVFFIGQTMVFQWMAIFIFLISVFHQPGGAVLDGMTMGFVERNPRYSFGQFRLWLSAGYGLVSLLVGYLARHQTAIIFNVSAALFILLSIFNLVTMPASPVKGVNLVNFKSLSFLLKNRKLLFFLLIIFVFGIAISPLYQFLNLYYKDIGSGNEFIGLVFFIQAMFEIPAFLLGVKLIRKNRPEKVILFSMLISMLRMVLYGFISNPLIAASLSPFHGITIALFLIGTVEYVQKQTPGHLRTTGLALIWAFHFGAGVALGNLLLGYLRDHGGILRAMHVHALIAAAVLVWAFWFFRPYCSSSR